MTTVRHIFLVDDDGELRDMTARYLEKRGLQVTSFASADDMLRRLPRLRPDLIVLDLMLPGTSGLETCRRLRGSGDDVPILMLTARDDTPDRIVGLEMGADDYVGKPFDPRELVARIEAVLRRRGDVRSGTLPEHGEALVGAWRFDFARRVLCRGGDTVLLSDVEYRLLRALVQHPRQPLSRDRLLELVHGRDEDLSGRSVDVAVHRIRRMVEEEPERARLIQTVRGVGYMFVPGEEP